MYIMYMFCVSYDGFFFHSSSETNRHINDVLNYLKFMHILCYCSDLQLDTILHGWKATQVWRLLNIDCFQHTTATNTPALSNIETRQRKVNTSQFLSRRTVRPGLPPFKITTGILAFDANRERMLIKACLLLTEDYQIFLERINLITHLF